MPVGFMEKPVDFADQVFCTPMVFDTDNLFGTGVKKPNHKPPPPPRRIIGMCGSHRLSEIIAHQRNVRSGWSGRGHTERTPQGACSNVWPSLQVRPLRTFCGETFRRAKRTEGNSGGVWSAFTDNQCSSRRAKRAGKSGKSSRARSQRRRVYAQSVPGQPRRSLGVTEDSQGVPEVSR